MIFYRLRLQHKLLPPCVSPGGNYRCNCRVFLHLIKISATKESLYFEFSKGKVIFLEFPYFSQFLKQFEFSDFFLAPIIFLT